MPLHTNCCVLGCLSSKNNTKLAFFSLPENPSRYETWLKKIDREDLSGKKGKYYYVCENHFMKNDILETSNRKILKKNCVPMLNLPTTEKLHTGTQTQIWSNGAFTQTDEVKRKVKHTQTPKRKLEGDDGPDKRMKGTNKDNFQALCDKYLSPELAQLVKTQANLKFNFKGNRYDDDYKLFCLNLYYTSPDAYKTLQKLLCLPCSNTLTNISIPITTEVNQKLIGSLKAKVDRMSDAERNCSIIVDSMSLKACLYYNIREDRLIGLHEVNGSQTPDPVRRALVVMARGIFENWKQPVGFALLSDFKHPNEISTWIDTVLAKLFDIGLNVRTFVSDLESDIMSPEEKTVTIDAPYFFVNNRKIYYVYDTPHLIKSVRDNLVNCDFHFGDSIATWKHIQQFYDYDKCKSFRLAPKLKESHINPTKQEKDKVLFATQLLSNSVAAGISNYVDFGVIEESARGTVKFVTLMNNLFDSLNASTLNDDYPYKRAYTGSEAQVTFFYQMLHFFQTLKLHKINNKKDAHCNEAFIAGFQITIKAIVLLYEDLKIEGYTFLLARRLNQEILAKFFGQVRTQIGTTKNPTSRQFVMAFRKLFLSNVIKPVARGGNGADDLAKLLTQAEKFEGLSKNIDQTTNLDDSGPSRADDQLETNVHMTCSDYNKLKIPEMNRLVFTCGYILKKCVERHRNCSMLQDYANLNSDQNDQKYLEDDRYTKYQSYTQDNTRPIPCIPPDDFVAYVQSMETHFIESFDNKNMNCEISAIIYKNMDKIELQPPCPCFPTAYARKLFIRIRLFYLVKHNNKLFGMRKGARRKYFSAGAL